MLMQAGVKHIILAVSYRAELLENEMKEQEEKVREGWRVGGGGGQTKRGLVSSLKNASCWFTKMLLCSAALHCQNC